MAPDAFGLIVPALLAVILWIPVLCSLGLRRRAGTQSWRRLFDYLWLFAVILPVLLVFLSVLPVSYSLQRSGAWHWIEWAGLGVSLASLVAAVVVAIIWRVKSSSVSELAAAEHPTA